MPATSPPLMLPDRYRVTRRIASGGMATVHAAEDTVLGRLVAVKVLASQLAADAGARERFQREARAAARVSDHPHVVTIYDIGEHDGLPFIVMEYFPGGTLGERLRSPDPIPRPQALAWLEDAADALDHAHRHGIVHRDVKPGNLLLDEHGRLGVADFGIARMANDSGGLTDTGQVLGTAAYLSPEQAVGEPATAASDRYALAVVAFELLTGRRPFAVEHVAAQARAHVEAEPPAASESADGLPAAVDRVLWRGLEKDPDRRWPTACKMVRALDDALGEAAEPHRTAATRAMAAAAAPPPRTPRPRTPVPRNRPLPPRTPVPRARPVPTGSVPPPTGPGDEPRRRRGWAPLALLAVIAVVAGGAIALLTGGDDGSTGQRVATGGGDAAAEREERRQARRDARQQEEESAAPAPTPAPEATTEAPTDEAPANSAAPTEDADTSPGAESGASSAELQATGHEALLAGDYETAIADLQRAVQGCPVTTTDPCAYAYYDLGRALRLAGRPDEAIPYLQTRLENPDQRATVQAELDQAEAAAARQ